MHPLWHLLDKTHLQHDPELAAGLEGRVPTRLPGS